jgi:methionyl-tRNA formyltransferase
MTTPARIIFAGTPEFAVPPLRTLIDSGHEVVAVLTQPDRPAGRGRKLSPSPIKAAALEAGIEVLQPESLQAEGIQNELQAMQADLMVVVAYGLLLPSAVLDIPARGCINIHASLLPRWRGASPIQTAILSGDSETGISIMQMDAGLDTGAVLTEQAVLIGADDTAGELHDVLAALGGKLLLTSLAAILAGELPAVPQDEAAATYAGRISKSDGLIDWTKSAQEINRQIRAYNPWPVAHTHYEGQLMRCLRSSVAPTDGDSTHAPGAVTGLAGDDLCVQTGEGILLLGTLQLAGRKSVSGKDFANAHSSADVVFS